MNLSPRSTRLLAAIPILVVGLGLLVPLAFFLRFAFAESAGAGVPTSGFTLSNFGELFTRDYYRDTLTRTFAIGIGSTLFTLVLGLAVAQLIVSVGPRLKAALIIMTVFPMFVGTVVRAVGWLALFGYDGVLNALLLGAGLIDTPMMVLKTPAAVAVAITSVELPIMVLTLYSGLQLIGTETTLAAQSLGAKPIRAFIEVTLPQMGPALVTGGSLVLVDSVNAYATPVLVGGSQVPMIAPEIYDSVTRTNDWALAGAFAGVTMVISLALIGIYSAIMLRSQRRWREVAQ
ncbi:ABC transporter permease [Ornithinimicrobium cryptoxanthini]|uniref:ABC transporter permease n=1 Tax=Ornithinimicrobium cryptoxanthini TaxID=2934161 RepID=A0ABY4YM12_9MICO|nr:ABC transporter permease [Ornithinimicrobium cryptoxanthini]USQ77831.1 ABC transporter permease [Ornithinimicrobium cryptoxanthini]